MFRKIKSMHYVLLALQYKKASSYSTLIFVISLFRLRLHWMFGDVALLCTPLLRKRNIIPSDAVESQTNLLLFHQTSLAKILNGIVLTMLQYVKHLQSKLIYATGVVAEQLIHMVFPQSFVIQVC